MDKDSSCCHAGKPRPDSYVGKGQEVHLGTDLRVYQAGSGNKHGVAVIYDIFGLDIGQTRRFVDMLAEHGFNVVMPDIFRGKPWAMDDFPPKDFPGLMKWVFEKGAFSIVEKVNTMCSIMCHVISGSHCTGYGPGKGTSGKD